MIYLLNADRGGADSVAHLIRTGKVTHLPCPTYQAYEGHCKDLLARQPTDDDLVILDTLTRLADSARGDMKLGADAESLWEKRNVYFSDKNYLTVYEAAGQLIMRRLRNLNNKGYRIVTICHEDEQFDQATMGKKRAPAINEALYKSLMGSCTDCFRLSVLREDEVNAEGAVVASAGSRLLQTTMDDQAICKYQVEANDDGSFRTVPRLIPSPTMRRVFKVLGKKPSWLVLYGEPGAGKTTLACSEANPVNTKKGAQE